VEGWVKAVDGVSFDVPCGSTLGLVGESGCGKSTVGRSLLKLIEPDGGRIIYKGNNIQELSRSALKPFRKELQIIFQDPFGSLNPRMTVGASIEEGLRAWGMMDRKARKARTEELLSMVGMIPSAVDRYPHEFSGGQRQRIGIARALSVGPSLIVCDEPISALDVSIQAQIINLLKDLQLELGLSYIFISHDLNVVAYISDTIAVMYLGKIMELGPADELFENPLHPYTQALISAIPRHFGNGKTGRRRILEGDVPSPFDPPRGCRFQGRCPLVEKRCRQQEVEWYYVNETHKVRCWKTGR
jgi:oligopeptide/dipeptide ABC transporter ATP-binding protein